MDPLNTNPNENQMPGAPVPPVDPVAPVTPEAPVAPEAPTISVEPVAPEAPTISVEPVAPEAPTIPAEPVAPEAPVMPDMPTPVAPVINPGAPAAAPDMPVSPVTPESVAASTMPDMPTPVAPVINPSDTVKVGATDPITMPNPPKPPDPIEEELKAPMQAAAPVPGSIGSAISMPANDGATVSAAIKPMAQQQNVAFNDPAAAQNPAGGPAPVKMKKKLDKKSLIMLCAIAGIVVVALVVVLISQMK